jgi:predicted HAD superfamily Cof-like phosphohydrolase
MSDFVRDIEEFHEKFDLQGCSQPGFPTREKVEMRQKFLQEELNEFIEACSKEDLEKAFDGLIDLVYVALGTSYLMGFPFDAGWSIVHSANMKKVRAKPDGSDSTRGSGFDCVKPEGWVAPNLAEILDRSAVCSECNQRVFNGIAHTCNQVKIQSTVDLVNHPPHYQSQNGMEVIDVLEAFDLGRNEANATKYILRAKHKGNEVQDLRKAIWYLNRRLKNIEAEQK